MCADTRKLATLRLVSAIEAIPDADRIALARIDGWQCVVGKEDFRPGDYCVYFEIDSFLPDDPLFLFLKKQCWKELPNAKGYRIKTIKLRGVLSQGLAMPLATLGIPADKFKLGDDLTRYLGVRLWDDVYMESLVGPTTTRVTGPWWRRLWGWLRWHFWAAKRAQEARKGGWPSYIRKTDQERLQNLLNYFTQYRDDGWEITTKLDGSSCTFALHKGKFLVCSRNMVKRSDTDPMVVYAQLHDVERKLQSTGLDNFALQGEFIGPKIQGNPEKVKYNDFYIFDIWLTDAQRYMLPGERLEFFQRVLKPLGFNHVPVIAQYHGLFRDYPTMDDMLTLARGKSLYADVREGIVCKHLTKPGISFKVINNHYLLLKG